MLQMGKCTVCVNIINTSIINQVPCDTFMMPLRVGVMNLFFQYSKGLNGLINVEKYVTSCGQCLKKDQTTTNISWISSYSPI